MSLETGSPAERTAVLAKLPYNELAGALRERRVVSRRPDGIILVTNAIGYPWSQNDTSNYRVVRTVDPLTLCVVYSNGNLITLAAALDNNERGGCVKLDKASLIGADDTLTRKLGPRDITTTLGLARGTGSRLAFVDDSLDLFVVSEDPNAARPELRRARRGRPAQALDRLLGQ